MNRRRIALDTAIVLGFSLFLLGLSIFYVMFLRPGHGDFTVCSQGVATSCWADPSGPIFMFLVLFGGAALFGVGALYRKTATLNLWESVLLGYIVILFFDLVILPEGALSLLPLNGGGILIFAFFLMSLVGIIVSAFKYIQTSNGRTPKEISPRPPLLAAPRRKKIYTLILIAGLMLAASLYLAPSIVYGGGWHSCYVSPGQLYYKISNYLELVGPPLFSQNYEQFLLAPGQSTFVSYVWNATIYGNNLTAWFSGPNMNQYNYTSLSRVNGITGWSEVVPVNQTGVNITFQNITFQGIHIAKILYKISITNSAPSATYYLYGGDGCALGLLLTVGSLPYWGPLSFGEIQPMALLANVLISLLAASILITIIHFQYSDGKNKDQEASLSRNQLTSQ